MGKADEPEDQDGLLFDRMADGDESALGALYDRWHRRIYTIAFWILNDADDAEDVVEETFWQAWRTASRFDGRRAAAATWLMLIARTRSLDRLRAERRRNERTAAASLLVTELSAGAPSGDGDIREDYRQIREALGSLPREQQEALELAFFSGLSHAQIASRTAQPLGTVKTRIRLAMQKLRERLGSLDGNR